MSAAVKPEQTTMAANKTSAPKDEPGAVKEEPAAKKQRRQGASEFLPDVDPSTLINRYDPGLHAANAAVPPGSDFAQMMPPQQQFLATSAANWCMDQAVWTKLYYGEIPEELLCQCAITECGLCGLAMTSPSMAKAHYMGKNHDKKARKWMEEWSERTGHPMPQRKPAEEQPLHELIDPAILAEDPTYCALCQIHLTSKAVAISHYQGKKHAQNVANPGRVKPPKPPADPSGKFGIGAAFAPPAEAGAVEDNKNGSVGVVDGGGAAATAAAAAAAAATAAAREAKKNSGGFWTDAGVFWTDAGGRKLPAFPAGGGGGGVGGHDFKCELCRVSCNTEAMLEIHMGGKSHKKKLVQMESAGKVGVIDSFCEICNVQCNTNDALEIHKSGKKHQKKAANMSQDFMQNIYG